MSASETQGITRAEIESLFTVPPEAAQKPKRKRPEAAVARAVTRVAERRGILCERRTVGFDQTRGIAYGTKGEPDHAWFWRGRACRVEEKAPGAGRLADHQKAWIRRHAANVPTFIVDSEAGADRVADLLTGPIWPVPGADLRGLR